MRRPRALQVLALGMHSEWRQTLRAPAILILAIAHALVLMSLVLLFGLTGSRAPVALVMEDTAADAQAFRQALAACHHSFALRDCDAASAVRELRQASVSAVITVPPGFSAALAAGRATAIRVDIDNVNADLSEDIRRALPSAIVAFGAERFPAKLPLVLLEHDRIAHDTGFIPYLAVSALGLDLLAIGAVLAAVTVCRDHEAGMGQIWQQAPLHPAVLLLGRMVAAVALAAVAIVPALLVVAALGILPVHPWILAATIAVALVCGCCLGAAVGVLVPNSTLAISLILGLSLALYLCSGALEPQRFDGEAIWYLAHLSPAYPVVALLERSVHGLAVTPEGPLSNLISVLGWSVLAALIAIGRFQRAPA